MQQGKTEKSSCGSKHNRKRVKGIRAIRSQRMANKKKKKRETKQTNRKKWMRLLAFIFIELRADKTPRQQRGSLIKPASPCLSE